MWTPRAFTLTACRCWRAPHADATVQRFGVVYAARSRASRCRHVRADRPAVYKIAEGHTSEPRCPAGDGCHDAPPSAAVLDLVGLDYSVALGSFGVTWPVLQAEIIAA